MDSWVSDQLKDVCIPEPGTCSRGHTCFTLPDSVVHTQMQRHTTAGSNTHPCAYHNRLVDNRVLYNRMN